ncbi:MAG TPA: phage holin family protein, partial [Microthrixaceae bacterium]|nr:phage holin family protein [Microthrixaceae bacterium]
MIRLIATAVVALIADAIALLVAAAMVDDMSITASGFVIAVGIFALVSLLVEPLTRQVALKNAPAILGSSTLIATVVSLVVTAIVSDSLTISGTWTWVSVAVI